MQKKVDSFYSTTLSEMKSWKQEAQVPFHFSAVAPAASDYYYTKTPFQCYSESEKTNKKL